MARHAVATVDEIPPGGRKIVTVAGRSIGIFNVDGRFYALRNQCPHAGGPLCKGVLSGLVEADRPGEYRYTRRGQMLRCPWHQWEFDIVTGQSWFDPRRVRVRSYETAVERPDRDGDLAMGPFVAETFPVSVEQELVVVTV